MGCCASSGSVRAEVDSILVESKRKAKALRDREVQKSLQQADKRAKARVALHARQLAAARAEVAGNGAAKVAARLVKKLRQKLVLCAKRGKTSFEFEFADGEWTDDMSGWEQRSTGDTIVWTFPDKNMYVRPRAEKETIIAAAARTLLAEDAAVLAAAGARRWELRLVPLAPIDGVKRE